jgi:hypothetical protein
VQCAFRAKPIFGGRSDWAASCHPELIGKKRRLLPLVMILHKFLSQHPNSSKSKMTGNPDGRFRRGLIQVTRSKLAPQPNPPFDPFNPQRSPIAGS